MGDNVRLGDRMGVRTPMHWTAGRNAGFSDADPSRLYAPVVTEPWYHFAGHNVESLDRKPTSFLNWMRRMIKTHRSDPAFHSGTLRALPVENRRVLAFVREHEGRCIPCVNNLSRFAHRGDRPVGVARAGAGRGDRGSQLPGRRRAALPVHARTAYLLVVPP